MSDFDAELNERLEELREQGLYRELRRVSSAQGPRIDLDGQVLLNFSSNDYLGLANELALKEAAIEAVERYGAGAGASRLICGSLQPHHLLEESLADFKGTQAALTFSSGYATALGTICALLGKDDVVIIDKLVHASIVDAVRLSGAKLRVFAHNDLNGLEDILKWAAGARKASSQILAITESIFSMDGDQAPLADIVDLKYKYGAWLMVDEAHATGIYGTHRRGLAEEMGVSNRIEIQMGTLGKALGAAGGYVCGSRSLIDYLINRARSFIFSTAPVPASVGAAAAGVRFVQSTAGEARRRKLWELVSSISFSVATSDAQSAILPLIIGDETKAVENAAALRNRGIYIPAVRYPTVARGTARLRLTVTAAHTSEDIDQMQTELNVLGLTKTAPVPAGS